MTKRASDNRTALFESEDVELDGVVERVYYSSEEFAILALMVGNRRFKCTGALMHAQIGDKLKGRFRKTHHEKYGEQYEVVDVSIEKGDRTTAGLASFLTYNVKGIGEATAEAIVKKFGEEAIDALEAPDKLKTVPGIGKIKAQGIVTSWNEVKDEYFALSKLYDLGLSPYQAFLCYRKWGGEAVHVLKEDVYRMTDVSGIGFKIADVVASKLGISEDDPRRLAAAAVYGMEEALSDGHTAVTSPDLLKYIDAKTNLTSDLAKQGITLALEQERVVIAEEGFAMLPYAEKAERTIIEHIQRKTELTSKEIKLKAPEDHPLSDGQRKIFEVLSHSNLATLTGGPGVGKTHTVSAIVKAAKEADLELALCAPTGKAARRMEEMAESPAMTIHRLLAWDPAHSEFTHNRHNPLRHDLIVVDESSMIDIFLMRSLLDAVSDRSKILFVGDVDQLPPVGPGQPFAVQKGEVVTLDEIFRQAADNPIIVAAHEINKGERPTIPFADDRLKFHSHDEADVIVSTLPSYLHELAMHNDGELPQIISPMNNGPLGIHKLNDMVKALVNPGDDEGYPLSGHTTVHRGDLLIQTRNDYDAGIMNGEQGRVIDYYVGQNKRSNWLEIETALGVTKLDSKQTRTFMLAYAITCHRAQGSQWDATIVLCHTSHYIMLTREWIYTALTRASQACWIVGNWKALNIAVGRKQNERSTLMKLENAWEASDGYDR